MGIRRVGEQTGVVDLVDSVGAVREDLLLDAVEVAADHNGLELHAQFGSQLTPLGEELERDVGDAAFVKFAIYYEVVFAVFHCCDSFSWVWRLADGVVLDELFHESLDGGVVTAVECERLFGREHHVLD